jgi:IclR family KDG regulon transcriptional repressor
VENTSRTVNKAIDILETFLQKDGALSLKEISELTGLNTTTAYRLISTLTKRGFLTHLDKSGMYALGLKTLDFIYALRRDLKFIDFAYVSMNKMSKVHNQSVYMAVLNEDKALVVEEVGVTEDLRINSPIGKRLLLHCTACGKILLASLSEEERKAYYGRNDLQPFTKNSIKDIDRLEEELAIVKTEGVAFDKEEYRLGIWAVAAPIYNGSGNVIASAGILIINSLLHDENAQKFATAIKSCTAEISQIIGRIS